MKKVYLDNSSTSFPKAPTMSDEIKKYIDEVGCNISRGGYEKAYDLEGKILETREMIASFFNFDTVSNVCFTPSVTYSLNYIIKGILKKGDHIIISSMEHNAVYRAVASLEDIEVSYALCDKDGYIDIDEFKKLFKDNTKLCVICHASNVSGTVQDVKEMGKICKENNVPFVLDSSQAAGVIDIDFKELELSALCVPGHKGLLGPQGIGLLLITDSLSKKVTPLISGGTGSVSDSEKMPEFLPDKFEAGTLNIPGIIGLNASMKYIISKGTSNIKKHELELTNYFIDQLKDNDKIRICGPNGIENRVGVVSLDFIGYDNADVSYRLDSEYGIMTRCGLHCAPLAHKTLGTYPEGTVRFSFGIFNTLDDVKYAIDAINKVLL